MNIFIAGGSGAIGRHLVPMLVGQGHRVVALTRTAAGAARLAAMGALPMLGDVFDARLDERVRDARPEVVIHQLTAFGAVGTDPLEATHRVRIEGTGKLVAAAEAAGARRFIAQSISFVCKPVAAGLSDERTLLYHDGPSAVRALAHAVGELERQTLNARGMAGVVLRYGWCYGRGTNFDPDGPIPAAIRRGRMALVGAGAGIYSFVDLHDAARATVLALAQGDAGIYNIVDDAPVRLSEWLPATARMLAAPPPVAMDETLARERLGDMMVYVFNEQCGASNRKAKANLGWEPETPSWRAGFERLYGVGA
jgi:nucleoside-diphosphate-sugar epimerase